MNRQKNYWQELQESVDRVAQGLEERGRQIQELKAGQQKFQLAMADGFEYLAAALRRALEEDSDEEDSPAAL